MRRSLSRNISYPSNFHRTRLTIELRPLHKEIFKEMMSTGGVPLPPLSGRVLESRGVVRAPPTPRVSTAPHRPTGRPASQQRPKPQGSHLCHNLWAPPTSAVQEFAHLQEASSPQHQFNPQPSSPPHSPSTGPVRNSGSLFTASRSRSLRAALSTGNRDTNATEVVDAIFGPAFSNLTTAQQLTTLERECHIAEAERRYQDAQICHDLLHTIARKCANSAQRAIQDRVKKLQPVKQKISENQAELQVFTKLWENNMLAFDAKAEEALNELKMRQVREEEDQEHLLRSQLVSLQPHFSRRVIDLRNELDKLLVQKHFHEADGIQKDLSYMETLERNKFDRELTTRFDKRMKQVKAAHQLEIAALKKRTAQARDELLGQRREDYKTLVQRHMIQTAMVDKRTREHHRLEHKQLQRQAVVIARKPAFAVDLLPDTSPAKMRMSRRKQRNAAADAADPIE